MCEKNPDAALAHLEDELGIRRLQVPAWLASVGKLEMRVAAPLSPEGQTLPSRVVYWQRQFAIFEDGKGNRESAMLGSSACL